MQKVALLKAWGQLQSGLVREGMAPVQGPRGRAPRRAASRARLHRSGAAGLTPPRSQLEFGSVCCRCLQQLKLLDALSWARALASAGAARLATASLFELKQGARHSGCNHPPGMSGKFGLTDAVGASTTNTAPCASPLRRGRWAGAQMQVRRREPSPPKQRPGLEEQAAQAQWPRSAKARGYPWDQGNHGWAKGWAKTIGRERPVGRLQAR